MSQSKKTGQRVAFAALSVSLAIGFSTSCSNNYGLIKSRIQESKNIPVLVVEYGPSLYHYGKGKNIGMSSAPAGLRTFTNALIKDLQDRLKSKFPNTSLEKTVVPETEEKIAGVDHQVPDPSQFQKFHFQVRQYLKYGIDHGSKNEKGKVTIGYGRAGLRYELYLTSVDSRGERLESETCANVIELADWKKPSPDQAPGGGTLEGQPLMKNLENEVSPKTFLEGKHRMLIEKGIESCVAEFVEKVKAAEATK